MIVVHAGQQADVQLIRRALGEAHTVRVSSPDSRRDQQVHPCEGTDGLECLILCLRLPDLAKDRAAAERWIARFPHVPIILVAEEDTRVAQLSVRLRPASVIWLHRVLGDLPSAVDEVSWNQRFRQLSRHLEGLERPPALSRALGLALKSATSTPYRSVQSLARDSQCSPVTLSQQFSAVTERARTLHQFLSALQVLSGVYLKTAGTPWKVVSRDLGIARDTLRRKARAWLDCTLRDLEEIPPGQLVRRFERDWIRPLTQTRRLARTDVRRPSPTSPATEQ